MFKARLTFKREMIVTIYAVQQLPNGLTQFLIYDENFADRWIWVKASEYEPLPE